MSESAEKFEDWIQDWLREQRKKVGTRPAGSQSSEQPHTANAEFSAHPWASLLESLWSQFDITRVAGAPTPALGLMREHDQAWRDLAAAHADYKRTEAELLSMLHRVQLDALGMLEQRIRARRASEPPKNLRELYDLWIECGEQVYAESSHSEAYCRAQAAFANAATELRAKQQALLERALKVFDLPTRAELNSLHRQLRDLREQVARTAVGSHSSKPSKTQARSVKAPAKQGKASVRRSARGSRKQSKAR